MGADLEVKALREPGRRDPSEAQGFGREGRAARWTRHLNSPNRRMRTRMSGDVAGGPSPMPIGRKCCAISAWSIEGLQRSIFAVCFNTKRASAAISRPAAGWSSVGIGGVGGRSSWLRISKRNSRWSSRPIRPMAADMRAPYLEVTFRHGLVLAAYWYLPRRPRQRSHRTVRVEPGLVIDYARNGQPIGIEISAPRRLSVASLNRVLRQLGQGTVSRADLGPLRAA